MFVLRLEDVNRELGTPEPRMPQGGWCGETIARSYYSWVCLWKLWQGDESSAHYLITDWSGEAIEPGRDDLASNCFELEEGEEPLDTFMRAQTSFSRFTTRLMIDARKFGSPGL